LIKTLQQIKTCELCDRLAVMFHETYVPPVNWKFKVMRFWQVRQYRELADLADVRLFSIEKWAEREAIRCPQRPASATVHVPVGSNLPFCQPLEAKSRDDLGIPPDAIVCGIFGSAHPSRLLDWLGAAVSELRSENFNVVVLYIGCDGEQVRKACSGASVFDQGRLTADEAARCFSAMDLYISPFIDGLSTRRGSVMAALQHGVPVVSTIGELTDKLFAESLHAVRLVDARDKSQFVAAVKACALDPGNMGANGAELYRSHFDWPQIALKVVDHVSVIPDVYYELPSTKSRKANPPKNLEVAMEGVV
jgi:glycosyltransferase involved in cell wall biosynthesis